MEVFQVFFANFLARKKFPSALSEGEEKFLLKDFAVLDWSFQLRLFSFSRASFFYFLPLMSDFCACP